MTAATRRALVWEAVALLALLAVGALVLARGASAPSLEFDEQVYLASADLLDRGFALGRDVVSSQPPLFLGFLHGAADVLDGDATLLRLVFVAFTLLGALGSWAIVRRLAGPLPALVTAGLVVAAPGVVEAAAVVSADVPCVVLGTMALLAARFARESPRAAAWGTAAGALLACALLTKLLAAPFAVAIAVAALCRVPPRRAVVGFGAGVLAVLIVVALVWSGVLGALWSGAVGMHLEARGADVDFHRPSIALQVALIVLAYAGLLAVLAAGLLCVPRGQLRVWAVERADLLALLAAGVLMCVVQEPLLNHHLVVVAWPLALLAGSAVPARLAADRRALTLVLVGLALVVPWTVHGRSTVPQPERQQLRAAAGWITVHTRPGDRVAGDLPGLALLARRTPAPETVDPSYVQLATGALTAAEVRRAASHSHAVIVGRSFRRVAGLRPLLDRRFARHRAFGEIEVWVAPRATDR